MFLQGYYLFMYHYCLFWMIFAQLSALRFKHFWCSGCLFGPFAIYFIIFFLSSVIPFSHHPLQSLQKEQLNTARLSAEPNWRETPRPGRCPLSSWLKWGETKPLLIIRHWCSIWKGFGRGGNYYAARQPAASKVAQILYLGYFSSCAKVRVSQLPLLSSGSGSWGSGWWISNVLANACRL